MRNFKSKISNFFLGAGNSPSPDSSLVDSLSIPPLVGFGHSPSPPLPEILDPPLVKGQFAGGGGILWRPPAQHVTAAGIWCLQRWKLLENSVEMSYMVSE